MKITLAALVALSIALAPLAAASDGVSDLIGSAAQGPSGTPYTGFSIGDAAAGPQLPPAAPNAPLIGAGAQLP